MADKYTSLTQYNYCGNDPVAFVDNNGLDYYVFDSKGQYARTIVNDESNSILVYNENNKSQIITMADPINDAKGIENKRLLFVSDNQIKNILSKADLNNVRNPILFILKESNAASLTGTGKMDFTGNGLNNIDASGRSLYVTATRKDGYIAHNGYNFGNFLWGAGARMLGIPGIIARLGAHINNFFNDLKTKWHFDSKDDQLSIQQGINWANEHAKE